MTFSAQYIIHPLLNDANDTFVLGERLHMWRFKPLLHKLSRRLG